MFYVQIRSGLGNQMFEYSFGRSKSLEQNRPLGLDISWYADHSEKDTPRVFLLDKYNIDAHIASDEELRPFNARWKRLYRKIRRRLAYHKDFLYNEREMRSQAPYFEGHWSNERYFKKHADTIRKDLRLKYPLAPASASVIEKLRSYAGQGIATISVHVRRGDCVTNPHAASFQGTVDTSYYDAAYDHLCSRFGKEKSAFFIFSDDIEWAKDHILTKANVVHVSRPEIPDYEELHIMSSCDHHIIANSTFSWWAAWLNASLNKIVIAPKRWLKDASFDTGDLCPAEWIRL